MLNSAGDDHKLTTAYLLCLCIQHSASSFPAGSFGKLLLKIVRRIQTIAWVSAWPRRCCWTRLLWAHEHKRRTREVRQKTETFLMLFPWKTLHFSLSSKGRHLLMKQTGKCILIVSSLLSKIIKPHVIPPCSPLEKWRPRMIKASVTSSISLLIGAQSNYLGSL